MLSHGSNSAYRGNKPFLFCPPFNRNHWPIDPRVTFITKDILREALSRGSNGRKTKVLRGVILQAKLAQPMMPLALGSQVFTMI